MNRVTLYLSIVLIAGIFGGCANQQAPDGGPIDKIPPRVIECYPDSNTVNYKDNYFEFTFSKYVDKRAFKDALFISPTVDGVPDISWSGKTVTVTLTNGFKKAKTYNVSVGTDLVDLNNRNRMDKTYSLTFSTGEKIDKGVIEGTLYDSKPSGVMAYSYTITDTLNITKHLPDYVSQVGEKGDFRLNGAAPGKYRVFLIRDEFKDFLYHPETNMIGIPSYDLTLAESDSAIKGLHYMLTKIDTVKPRLSGAAMTDRYHIIASFTKEINDKLLSKTNFTIYDSTTNKSLSPVYGFKGKVKPAEYVLAVNQQLPDSNKIFLIARDFSDKIGNKTVYDYATLLVNTKPDTSAPFLFNTEPASRAIDQPLDTGKVTFSFDDGFNFDTLKNYISLIDTQKNNIPIGISKIDDASFSVSAKQKLKSHLTYSIKFPFDKAADIAGNKIDSLYEYKFTTINELDNTGIHGRILNSDAKKNPLLVLMNTETPSIAYTAKIEKDSLFNFDKIKPGKYKLMCYYDLDGNGAYNYGNPNPFIPSEPFMILSEIITAPARWAVTDVVLDVAGMK